MIRKPQDLEMLKNITVKPQDLELVAFHPMGTCRMGADPRKSVVNEHCETHDVRGLFVPDGSIFPTSLGVNPQESIMAMATRTADHILDTRS